MNVSRCSVPVSIFFYLVLLCLRHVVFIQKESCPERFSNSRATDSLEAIFEEFQFLNDARMDFIRNNIGHCFKRAQEIVLNERPGADRVLPSEMALLHMTYERVPDVNKMNFTVWATVHEITEADVRLYFRERYEREAALIAAQDRAPAASTASASGSGDESCQRD
ncbi:hypothetical protein L5515_018582 [Caenorhabditis briggsae]|uniref:Uncharacterized protein n=1 Tax=Caenorhabditis briggsae TaxID=6238 RepID=A0AAE9JSG7_CAEBR|nr:hypothetical protein L5515_018582 [Caenorhabditis briggsae]